VLVPDEHGTTVASSRRIESANDALVAIAGCTRDELLLGDGCMHHFRFHAIKIDKSFVTRLFRDPHVLAVAHATINVIENLGMVSVAGGIEDPTEVAMLPGLGCRRGQGHHFAPALPPHRVLAHQRGALARRVRTCAATGPAGRPARRPGCLSCRLSSLACPRPSRA
jgi:predicted signal transduction protein with EAL and GGDEF domain